MQAPLRQGRTLRFGDRNPSAAREPRPAELLAGAHRQWSAVALAGANWEVWSDSTLSGIRHRCRGLGARGAMYWVMRFVPVLLRCSIARPIISADHGGSRRHDDMKIGDRVTHRTYIECGIGRITRVDPDGLVEVVFPTATFHGFPDSLSYVAEESTEAYQGHTEQTEFVEHFVNHYQRGTLADLDSFFGDSSEVTEITADDFAALKLTKVRSRLEEIGLSLDDEQAYANARPETRLLVKARAGSGKTRTLCARAVLAIRDEKLDANQVLILAFNRAAAAEIKHRVRETAGNVEYENARTFHSLAHQLVKPQKTLLADAKEQSRFVHRLMPRILNPAFKEAMVDFFRKELEQIENLGRDLAPAEYFIFRRALEQVSLNGERVKSNGEKFIADFLFEHGIEYRYEKAWVWRTPFLDGATYKPDFSIIANGNDYILEHWAFDLDNPHAELPKHWDTDADHYRRQICNKRAFWETKNISLLETHIGLISAGRAAFEEQLRAILEGAGIRCQCLAREEIVRRVFANDFAISQMAELFLQFIQRAKKRGWSVDDTAQRAAETPDEDPRTRLFHQLALRAYREYETALVKEQTLDFDDLLSQATEEVRTRGAAATIHLGRGTMMPIGDLRWILLDEYQDFSELYYRIIEAILQVNPKVRLMAVGDDWQAINGFAGAELRFFDDFIDYFPGAESAGMATNYRSNRSVVAAGNQLMEGRGAPARPSRNALVGEIKVQYLGDVWVEFREGAQYQKERDADSLYLPPHPNGKNPSEQARRQAQVLKMCAAIIGEASDKKTLLVGRTNKVYGIEIKDFRSRLIAIVAKLLNADPGSLEDSILAMTAHRSKGQEAHTVIILDATQKQFPKVHPDNLLFGLFGVTPHAVLEEERRLFYVAITRAEQRLFILTEKGTQSPYLESIWNAWAPTATRGGAPSNPLSLGALAQRILKRIAETEGAEETQSSHANPTNIHRIYRTIKSSSPIL